MPRDTPARPTNARPSAGRPASTTTATTTATATARTTRANRRAPLNAPPIPFDRASDPNAPAYDALSADLAAAGRRARNRKVQLTNGRPDPAFSEALRGRLLQPAGARAAAVAAAGGIPLSAGTFENMAHRGAAVALTPDALPGPLTRPRSRVQAGSTARRTSAPGLLAVLGIGVVVLAVAAAGLVAGRFAISPANRVGEAVNATLIRSGGSQALVAGSALTEGDEIRVAADGHATLDLGSSQTRLAGGADLRLNVLSGSTVQLALLGGRAYHRVVLPAGGSYAVVTGPYSWTASGTAFDLDRTPAAAGGEQVRLLALEHAVAIDGPEAHLLVPEGSSATVLFGNPTSTGATVGPIPTTDFSDPWLINNAKLDESLGYPIGALARVALAPNDTPVASPSPSIAPTETPSESPTDSPSAEPSPSDSPSVRPSPTPELTPNPTPSASPSPSPIATPKPSFGLSLTSCPGGVVLSWSRYTGSDFARYVTLRGTSLGSTKAYPPQGATAMSTTAVRTHTTAADASLAGTYFYRVFALDSANNVLAASGEGTAPGRAQAVLSPVSINVGAGVVSWGPFSQAACFSEYRLLYSTDPDPTLANSLTLSVKPWTQTNVPIPSANWYSGHTYYFRIQVVRDTFAGSFVVGQSSNIQSYTYP